MQFTPHFDVHSQNMQASHCRVMVNGDLANFDFRHSLFLTIFVVACSPEPRTLAQGAILLSS